jgi:hypothetical protein
LIVMVVWATPQVQDVVPVELVSGATVAEALRASGLVAHYGLDPAGLEFARFGAHVDSETPLADGDRVEIVRTLAADPKAARARRARARTAAATAARSGRGRN